MASVVYTYSQAMRAPAEGGTFAIFAYTPDSGGSDPANWIASIDSVTRESDAITYLTDNDITIDGLTVYVTFPASTDYYRDYRFSINYTSAGGETGYRLVHIYQYSTTYCYLDQSKVTMTSNTDFSVNLYSNTNYYPQRITASISPIMSQTVSGVTGYKLNSSFTPTSVTYTDTTVDGKVQFGLTFTLPISSEERDCLVQVREWNEDHTSYTSLGDLIVHQPGVVGSITPEDSDIELTWEAQTVTQNITTVNMDDSTLTVRSNASWATVSLDNKVLSITCTSAWSLTSLRGTAIIISGTDLAGVTKTATILLRQKVRPGEIYLDRDSITVPADHRFYHRDVNVYTNLLGSNLTPAISEFTPSITGDVTGTFSWYNYVDENQNNRRYLVFTPDDNETENTLTGTITVSGVDLNGDTITNSYTVTQRPYNPDLVFDPHRDYYFSGDSPLNIMYNENSTTFNLTCNSGIVSVDSVKVGDYSSNNDNLFSSYYQSGTVTKLDDTHYTAVITTRSNTTRTPSKNGNISVNVTTEFGHNPWQNQGILSLDNVGWCDVRKCGIPGSITLTPSTKTVYGEAGSTTFNYSADSYMVQPISVTHTGNMNITNFTISGNNVVVEYGENRGRTVLTETITATGADYQGLTITQTVTLNQEPLSVLEFIETEKTIDRETNTVTFRISDINVTNLRVSQTGDTSIISSATLTETEEGHLLTVVTNDNPARAIKTVTFAVSGKAYNNTTLSSAAVLHKTGADGIITLSPALVTRPKTSGEFTIDVTSDGMDTSTFTIHTLNVSPLLLTFNSDHSQITFPALTNDTGSNKYYTVWVAGTDYKNSSIRSSSCVITHLPYNSKLEITPESKTLDYGENSTTYSVEIMGVEDIQVSYTGDFITNATINNGVLTVTTADFSTREEKTATITVSGTGFDGAISDSVTLNKYGPDAIFTVDPTSIEIIKSSSTFDITITKDGVGELACNSEGNVSFSSLTFNSNQTTLTAVSVTNGTSNSLTGTINIAGVDYKGNSIVRTVNVTQLPYDSVLDITPASQTLQNGENGATYTANIINVDNVQITTSGDDDFITSTSISNGSLIVNTTDFTERELKVATITVTGTGYDGQMTSSVTLSKYGPDGIITVDTTSIEVPKTGSSFTVNVTKDGIEDVSASSSGDIDFTSLSFNNDKTVLTVNYGTNSTDGDLTGTITISGTDYKGNTITQTVSVTQLLYYFKIVPENQIVPHSDSITTATITVEADGVTFTNIEVTDEDTYNSQNDQRLVVGYARDGNTVTFRLNPNKVNNEHFIYLKASGLDSNGNYVYTTGQITVYGENGYITATAAVNGWPYWNRIEWNRGPEASKDTETYRQSFGFEGHFLERGPRDLDVDWITWGGDYYFKWSAYSGPATKWDDHRVAHFKMNGIDYKGELRTKVIPFKQWPVIPDISVSPKTQEVEWNEYVDIDVTLTGAINPPSLYYTDDEGVILYDKPISYTWLGEWGDSLVRTNTVRIVPPPNTSVSKLCTDVNFQSTCLWDPAEWLKEANDPDYLDSTATFCQKGKPATITLTPSAATVNKNAGSVTFAVSADGVEQSSLTRNWTGEMITSASFNSDKTTLTVNYSANPDVASRTAEICVSDPSDSVTGCATITQTGEDPEINVENLYIRYNESSVTHFIGTKSIEDLSIQINGDVTITDYTLTPTTNGYNLVVETPDNNTTQIYRSTATLTGTVSEGQYEGQTRTATFEIVKYGIAGAIEINPTSKTVYKSGETVVFGVALINMDNSSVTASVGTFNADKSQLTVVVGENTSTTTRTINVVVSGTDLNNNSQSATAVITQYGIDPYISISPESQTLSANESIATYSVTAYLVSNLSVSLEGVIEVISYSLVNGVLTIETADNTELLSLMETITITGTTENGDIVSGTATLVKFGTGGGVVINPVYTIGGNAGLLAVPYNSERIKEDTVYAYINGDINVTNIAVNRDGQFIYIEYNANSGSTNKVSTLTLSCYDEDDVPRYATSTITQLTSSYSFSLNPTRRTVEYTGGTVTHSVTSNNVNSIELFESYGNMDATYSYSGGSVSISIGTNSDSEKKYGVVTLTGISSSGNTVTTSAYIIQNNEYYNDFRFELVDSTQENVTVDGGGKKLYYDILSVNKSYGTFIPYYVSGFILTGYWGSLPTVKYRDGFPYVIMPINTKEATRDAVVTFLQEQSYLELSAHIHQEEGAEPDVHPIWEIVELTAPNESFAEYHITTDGDIIYAGKAYRYPEEYKTVWTVNDTVSNYLGNGIYFSEGLQQIPNYSKDFFIGTNTNAKYVKTFYNSWAYEHTNYWLSDPIDKRVDPRQWLPVSFISTEYPSIDVAGRNYVTLMENSGWTVMTNLRNYALNCNSGVNAIGRNNEIINYKVDKGDYVLYYSNAYGGWDALLVSGTVRQSDNIEHLTYKRHSASQTKFSKINYQNNITPTWTLKTGITVDGNKMYHLLESTMVYLHNLTTNKIVPVIVTNSQCEYMTYRNNGKKPYFYNITVEASNTKLRK